MTNEEIIKEIPGLPKDAKLRIVKIIDTFRKQVKPTMEDSAKKVPLRKSPRKPEKRSFRDEPFFGMWKDREDMKEGGAAWVRNLREGPHWNRLKRDDPR